jgi:hypothetical protein
LSELKKKIAEDKEYFKDLPEGYVEDGRIRIMNDEQMEKVSLFADLVAGKTFKKNGLKQGLERKNLFCVVASYAVNANGLDYGVDMMQKKACKDASNVVCESIAMNRRIENMEASERKTKGHQPFRTMLESLKETQNLYSNMDREFVQYDKKGKFHIDEDAIEIYKEQLRKSLKTCNDYLQTKNEKKIMKLSRTSNGYERYMLAKDAKESIEKAINALDGIVDKKTRMDNYSSRINTFKKVCNDNYDKIVDKRSPLKENLSKKALEIAEAKAFKNEKSYSSNLSI